MAIGGDLVVNLTASTAALRRELGAGRGLIGEFAGFARRALTGIAVAGAIKETISAASGLEETLNKFNVVFADQATAVRAWGDEFANQLGRSKNQVYEFLAGSQDLFVPLGFEPGAAQELSKQITSLSIDLASFNNLADADVLRDLHAALTGSGEVMKKYGVIVSEAAVKQEAFNMGLNPRALTEQQKVQARLNIILRGTTAAQGDATRSAGSFANQMKALKAELINLAATVGADLLPLITPVVTLAGSLLKVVSALVRPVLKVASGLLQIVASPIIQGIARLRDLFTQGIGPSREVAANLKTTGQVSRGAAVDVENLGAALEFATDQARRLRNRARDLQVIDATTLPGALQREVLNPDASGLVDFEGLRTAADAISGSFRKTYTQGQLVRQLFYDLRDAVGAGFDNPAVVELRDRFELLAGEASGITAEVARVQEEIDRLSGSGAIDLAVRRFDELGATAKQMEALRGRLQELERVKLANTLAEEIKQVRQEVGLLTGELTKTDAALARFAGADPAQLQELRGLLDQRDRLERLQRAQPGGGDQGRGGFRGEFASALRVGTSEAVSRLVQTTGGRLSPEKQTAANTAKQLEEQRESNRIARQLLRRFNALKSPRVLGN